MSSSILPEGGPVYHRETTSWHGNEADLKQPSRLYPGLIVPYPRIDGEKDVMLDSVDAAYKIDMRLRANESEIDRMKSYCV
jgi:hypothetical protein